MTGQFSSVLSLAAMNNMNHLKIIFLESRFPELALSHLYLIECQQPCSLFQQCHAKIAFYPSQHLSLNQSTWIKAKDLLPFHLFEISCGTMQAFSSSPTMMCQISILSFCRESNSQYEALNIHEGRCSHRYKRQLVFIDSFRVQS